MKERENLVIEFKFLSIVPVAIVYVENRTKPNQNIKQFNVIKFIHNNMYFIDFEIKTTTIKPHSEKKCKLIGKNACTLIGGRMVMDS